MSFIDRNIFDELTKYMSGAKENDFCFINRNLNTFHGLQPYEGSVVKVIERVKFQSLSFWTYTPLIILNDGTPVEAIPDCVLTPIPKFDPEENTEEDEMIKIAGKAPSIEPKVIEKV